MAYSKATLIVLCILTLNNAIKAQSVYLAESSSGKTATNDGKVKHNFSNEIVSPTENILNNNECILTVNNRSRSDFTYNVLRHRYNFVYLNLQFVNFSVNATWNVIAKHNWIWTYKGDDGANQYLYIPEDFGYMSFGLLWAHTKKDSIFIDIEQSGLCMNLTIGLEETDRLIGTALGKMTSEVAAKYEPYNSSLWCYNKRLWIHSDFLYEFCKNSICTLQTIEYECCRFSFDYIKKKRVVKCHKEHYYYGDLWWMLPIIAGNVCFAYYPLLLTKIGIKVNELSKTMKNERLKSANSFKDIIESHSESNGRKNKSKYVHLKSSNPVTVFSTLLSPLFSFFYGRSKGLRTLRIWIIILPMCLSATHVLVDYLYAYEFMVSAVQTGALIGYSSLLAGPSEARKGFMNAFGGPIVTSSICFSFGCLLIVVPANLEDFITIGISQHIKKFVFLAKMPLRLKENMSGINVRHLRGCKKLHQLFLAQIFMLILPEFWKRSMKLFYLRWKNMIFLMMYNRWQNMFIAIVLGVVIFPLYIVFCITELLLAVLYYLFPVVNCFFIILISFRFHYYDCFHPRILVVKWLQHLLFTPLLIVFLISWYTYSITFFDGFWFVCRVAMLSFSGIVAYPNLSYGYLVLVLMTLFYATESINTFGESYRELLKVSIEACKKFQHKFIDDNEMDQEEIKSIRTKYGVRIDLFEFIIRRNLPRRNQLLITMSKLMLVIIVLLISVKLLVTFDKLKDLSIVMHVFTVLFVCAIPKIIKMICLQNHKNSTRSKMKQKVFMTITEFITNNKNAHSENSNDEHESVFISRSGYESFTDYEQ